MIEIKLEDFQRIAEENENLQKIIKDKNQRIIFLEDKVNYYEKFKTD